MAEALKIRVNDREVAVAASPDTPLLYVLAGEFGLKGPRFGCGLAQCGSCSVLLDGAEIRSCVTPVGAVAGKAVTTLEGLPALYAAQRKRASVPALHPLQRALIDEQAPQCGYCYNGMIIKGSELLANNAGAKRCRNSPGDERPSVPLRQLSAHSWRRSRPHRASWRRTGYERASLSRAVPP